MAKKSKQNITGLWNQPKLAPSHVKSLDTVPPPIPGFSDAPQVSNGQNVPQSALSRMIIVACCLLSKQEDFTNQISMLETVIQEAGHKCIFLPKFHCELNPIEMVSLLYFLRHSLIYYILSLSTVLSIGDGLLEIQTVGYIFPFVLIA